MPLMPKRVKHRKSQRGKVRGEATRGNRVAFGEYGLQVLEAGWITAQQLEAGRVAATHFLHREGRLWTRVFPHKPVTATPAETRRGKATGEPACWVAGDRPATILCERGGGTEDLARQAFNRVAHKMPLRVRFVARRTRA